MSACTHETRSDGPCPECGQCEHDVVLNAACYFCGETDLRLTIKVEPDLIPASTLNRRRKP